MYLSLVFRLRYCQLNCCSCVVTDMLSRVILAIDWLNQLLSAYDIAQLLNILNFDVAVDDDFSMFGLHTLYVFDFRGVYFCLCWAVCNATLTFSIESNGPNYSDKPGVLSKVSGVLQRLGWTSVLPLVARCHTSSTPGGGLLRPSSCQSIPIYLGPMTSRIPTSIVRLSCAQIGRGNYWSSWRLSTVERPDPNRNSFGSGPGSRLTRYRIGG